jgi:transposase
MFLDYAGAKIPIDDPATGAVQQAAVFVAVLGASSYTFSEATSGQDLRNWIGSQMRAFEFFGGVTEVLVPDNLKSGVKHPSYYEPDLNPTYRDLAEHYGAAIIPARPYRARDKAKAEVGVQVVQRWIIAALRKRKFFSLAEVNEAIAELLVWLNQRPFKKREGSRATLFASFFSVLSSSNEVRIEAHAILCIPSRQNDAVTPPLDLALHVPSRGLHSVQKTCPNFIS